MTAPMSLSVGTDLYALVRDEAAFRAWYDDSMPRVSRYLVSRCGGDHTLAEDLAALECRLRFVVSAVVTSAP